MPTDVNLEPVDIVNRALARFGGGEIMDLEEDGDLQRQAQMIYDTEVEYALGRHPWRFATQSFKLDRLAHVPVTGYAYAYALPGTRLGYPHAVYDSVRSPDRGLSDYWYENDELHCNASEVWVRCVVQVAPTVWPPEFRKAMIVAIAAGLCVPVSHDLNLAASLRQEAYGSPAQDGTGGLMGQAIAKEAALSPPRAGYGSDPLTSARYAGMGYCPLTDH